MKNKSSGDGEWISFRSTDKAIKADYNEEGAMVVEFHKAGASDHYLMEVDSHGLNRMLGFRWKGRYLHAEYDSSDAMPVKIEDLGNGCVTMENMWPGEEG